jgi:hypothetical protein
MTPKVILLGVVLPVYVVTVGVWVWPSVRRLWVRARSCGVDVVEGLAAALEWESDTPDGPLWDRHVQSALAAGNGWVDEPVPFVPVEFVPPRLSVADLVWLREHGMTV